MIQLVFNCHLLNYPSLVVARMEADVPRHLRMQLSSKRAQMRTCCCCARAAWVGLGEGVEAALRLSLLRSAPLMHLSMRWTSSRAACSCSCSVGQGSGFTGGGNRISKERKVYHEVIILFFSGTYAGKIELSWILRSTPSPPIYNTNLILFR